jgi:hypothetical protein
LKNASPATAGLNTGGSNAAGAQDLLAVGGSLTFASGAALKIEELTPPSFTAGPTYSWIVATYTGTAPTFAGVTFDLSAAPTFAALGGIPDLSLTASGGNVFLNFQPTPEPGSILLLCAGSAGLVAFLRGRLRRAASSSQRGNS